MSGGIYPPTALAEVASICERAGEAVFEEMTAAGLPASTAAAYFDHSTDELVDAIRAAQAKVKARHGILTVPHARHRRR